MARAVPIAALILVVSACALPRSDLPVQEEGEVLAAFRAAIRACTAGITPEGAIDQAALRRLGWRPIGRKTHRDGADRAWPVDSYPVLESDEYMESSEWTRNDLANHLHVYRYQPVDRVLQDDCGLVARTRGRREAERVVEEMSAMLGRRPDRSGELPRGGDFLTPRFDKPGFGHYWALPKHDLHLSLEGRGTMSLSVLAMPDRASLDEYSPDRPEARIPFQEGTQ